MAAYSEITIEQYSTFNTTLNVEDVQGDPINLYGYSVSSQIRKSYYSSTATDFTASIDNYANGEISLTLSSANTANLQPGRYVYDVLITGVGETTRVVEGIVTVLPGVTRNA